VLTGIAVTPAGPAVPRGATLQFAATGTYSDGSSAALTSGVTWASSAPSVATISPSGLATALATGTTTISATMGSVTGSTLMTVSRNKATPLVQATIHDESHQPVSLVTSGRSVHALINVSGIASVPTGTVKLKWFANASCSGKAAATSTAFALVNGGVDATGFAQAPSAAGTYGFLPEYSGDTLYAAAVAACQAVTVPPKQAPTLQTTIHDASHTAVTQAAVRTSLHPAVVMNAGATGTVTASWFANAKCSGRATVTGSAVLVNGTADVTALTVAPTKAGSYAVLVSYGGDNTFLAATGTCQVVTVR
jgi:hypothetical protein